MHGPYGCRGAKAMKEGGYLVSFSLAVFGAAFINVVVIICIHFVSYVINVQFYVYGRISIFEILMYATILIELVILVIYYAYLRKIGYIIKRNDPIYGFIIMITAIASIIINAVCLRVVFVRMELFYETILGNNSAGPLLLSLGTALLANTMFILLLVFWTRHCAPRNSEDICGRSL